MPSFFCMPFSACNRQIDSIDRRQSNLQQVPHEVTRYARSLEELLLDMNHIKELPKELFRLNRLRILGLSDNDINKVPSDISALGSLEELNLSRNDISDLPDEIRLCKGLTRLELSSNPFTLLPSAVSHLSSLTHLGLNDVSLTQLPTDIGSLINLRSLEVRENLIRTLPLSLCQLTQLQVLDLGQNDIDQLPQDMGSMQSLRELYIDANDLECLPDQITQCRNLEQLDVSENKVMLLPEEFGDLSHLTDLNVSQNIIQQLPNSMGRLKRLSILKAEKNVMTHLTISIGSCEQLQELFLTENLLTELPSSIGNLRQLKTLNVDKNQLTSIPTTIGGCSSLSVLSLRENQLSELPMDIGKCEGLTVLDVCSNRLSYLPFTIKVLFRLQALWLFENQTQALLKLQEDREPRTGVKVLTCYLLPQQSAATIMEAERGVNRSFLGGPKVHFGDQEDTTIEDDSKLPIGEFHRHDTPHPKPHSAKLKKNTIDGHVIHHEDDHQPSTLSLNKKPSMDASSPSINAPPPMPRSALRQYPQPERSPSQRMVTSPITDNNNSQDNRGSRSVLFASPSSLHQSSTSSSSHIVQSSDMDDPPRLKRINTPHYKSIRCTSSTTTDSSSSTTGPKIRRIRIHRDGSGNLGLSIAGGLESTPFKDDDKGLFVSRVQEGGPAEKAGLRVGDKLIRVNDYDVLLVTHETAVRAMQECREEVELSILRIDEGIQNRRDEQRISSKTTTPINTPDVSFTSESGGDITKETISVSIKRDSNGSPGFAVAGGAVGGVSRDGIFISHITRGGSADGKLMIGDRVVSIDGTTMKDTRHDQAVALLTGTNKEVHLIVHRERPSHLSPLPLMNTPTIPSSSSIPLSTPLNTSSIRTPSPASSPVYSLGDSSWDHKTETVELIRDGASLGLSVVGGSDHVSHPFGVHNPGVFISKIAINSAADKCRRLRVGDRILRVNEVDVKDAKHAVAVDALKASGSRVKLIVTHDPQPSGMKEVIVRRRGDGPLGISIHGGVKSNPANPRDSNDEGIFIDRVEIGSISEIAGLVAGQRIVEVNGESLLGATQLEAASSLKKAHELRLLVCDGYNTSNGLPPLPSSSTSSSHLPTVTSPTTLPSTVSHHSSSSLISKDVPSSSPSSPHKIDVSIREVDDEVPSPIPPVSPILSSHELSSSRVDDLLSTDAPLASSSPLPSTITTRVSKLPAPPVPPKSTTLKPSQTPNKTIVVEEVENPEMLAFSSKLKNFEKKMELAANGMNPRPNPPDKIRLLDDNAIKSLKESEALKVSSMISHSSIDSPENNDDFLSIIEKSLPRGPGSIRTKKAENRAVAAGLIELDESNGLSRTEREMAKREQWRNDRLASVVSAQEHVDALLQSVTPMLKNIDESNEKSGSPMEEIQYADEEL